MKLSLISEKLNGDGERRSERTKLYRRGVIEKISMKKERKERIGSLKESKTFQKGDL